MEIIQFLLNLRFTESENNPNNNNWLMIFDENFSELSIFIDIWSFWSHSFQTAPIISEQEEAEGKYWAYPFYRGLEIYNQDKLLLDPRARYQVEHFGLVLVEGFFDVASLVGSGLLNVGALMGSQMTIEQVTRLKFISSCVAIPHITIFLDRDEAGIAGSQKALSLLRSNGFSVDVFDWNQASQTTKDPGDMSVKQLKWFRKEGKIWLHMMLTEEKKRWSWWHG